MVFSRVKNQAELFANSSKRIIENIEETLKWFSGMRHGSNNYPPNNFLNHDRFGAGSVAVDFCNRISISGGTGVWMA